MRDGNTVFYFDNLNRLCTGVLGEGWDEHYTPEHGWQRRRYWTVDGRRFALARIVEPEDVCRLVNEQGERA